MNKKIIFENINKFDLQKYNKNKIIMEKNNYKNGVVFNDQGWRAQIVLTNKDKYYTIYFKNYNEAAIEYNRVLKSLINKIGKRGMLKLELPTKLLKLKKNKISWDQTGCVGGCETPMPLEKKTRSGKKY